MLVCGSGCSVDGPTESLGEDPGLDQFMEAYCEMLVKYEQELSKPFKEALVFLQRVECQFKSLSLSSPSSFSGCSLSLSLNLCFSIKMIFLIMASDYT